MNLPSGVWPRFDPRNLFYGWWIVLAGSASNFLLLGVLTFSFGVFIKPMQKELGWSVTAIAWGISLRSFESGALSPFTGYLVDRVGPRKMGVSGVVISTVGLLIFSYAHDLWVYYLASMTISLGQSVGAFTPFSVALMSWFHKKRGRAMGLLNTGNALGYFAVAAVAALVSAYGWRETLRIAAGMIFVLGIPLALVLRRNPEAYGYLPDGARPLPEAPALNAGEGRVAQPPYPTAGPGSGMSLAEALRTPALYLLALAVGLGGATFTAWAVFLVPHLENVGFSTGAIAWIIGIYGVIQAALRVAAGWMGDALGRRRMFGIGCLLWGIGILIFANLTSSRIWMLPLLYLTASVGHASWSVIGQTAVADYFGTRRFATIRGASSTVQLPLGIFTPVLVGRMFDRYGNYTLAYELIAALVASGALCLLLVRRPMWGAAVGAVPGGGGPIGARWRLPRLFRER